MEREITLFIERNYIIDFRGTGSVLATVFI